MTSSLRKSIHRRNHKERGQLAHRQRLGILEKHADYVKRARDYHSKQDRLNRLRQKAADRNKDEFYFSMSREKTKRGVHQKDRGNIALPTDIVKVLKTQDENYLRTMRTANRKKIDKLKLQLTSLADLVRPLDDEDTAELDKEEQEILIDAGILPKPSKGKGKARAKGHIVFVDSAEEWQKRSNQSSSSEALTAPSEPSPTNEDLGWKAPPSKKKKKAQPPPEQPVEEEWEEEENGDYMDSDSDTEKDPSTRHRGRLLKELSARLARDTQLGYAMREFEMQRQLMGKGARKKLAAPEKLGSRDDEDSDSDDFDTPRRKHNTPKKTPVDPSTYKPRVYKWRQERKK